VSAGLTILDERNLAKRWTDGRSSHLLVGYDKTIGWAKFPAAGLYNHGAITAFSQFHLRVRSELDALKMYFLLASRRDRNTNLTKIAYETIEEYSGISRGHIPNARTLLSALGLIRVEHVPSSTGAAPALARHRPDRARGSRPPGQPLPHRGDHRRPGRLPSSSDAARRRAPIVRSRRRRRPRRAASSPGTRSHQTKPPATKKS